jgi:hypothetical protein
LSFYSKTISGELVAATTGHSAGARQIAAAASTRAPAVSGPRFAMDATNGIAASARIAAVLGQFQRTNSKVICIRFIRFLLFVRVLLPCRTLGQAYDKPVTAFGKTLAIGETPSEFSVLLSDAAILTAR